MVERTTLRGGFRALFNACCCLVLILFFLHREDVVRTPFPRQSLHLFSSVRSSGPGPRAIRRIREIYSGNLSVAIPEACSNLSWRESFAAKCKFLTTESQCESGGLFDYLIFFYCVCGKFPVLGYIVLGIWMGALFYLLGNTAADYFCTSLANLSSLLRFSPTVAGVTLLPLGNGAPDVFSSIAAFMGSSGTGEVGLNSVLGGATFVTCAVVGIISFCVDRKYTQIDRKCFIRDVCFFLFTLASLSIILIIGKISVWGAILFVMIYLMYAIVVAANELLKRHARRFMLDSSVPLLPVGESIFSSASDEDLSMYSHFLDDGIGNDVPRLQAQPKRMWNSNIAIYAESDVFSGSSFEKPRPPPWGWNDEEKRDTKLLVKLIYILEIPLSLPRRLTIPVIEEERWSKPFAVTSATLAPILWACVWNDSDDDLHYSVAVYAIGALAGLVLGGLALLFTCHDHPPRTYLLLWVLGGFVMSILWFYIVANELLALLVSLGIILQISPSILGLTVLAWGNSMGDLMSNVALALSGGDAVQVAMSGCYAGPMFNTLVGLGISMLLGACSARPESFMLPQDGSWVFTMFFLMSGLLWALVVLPRNDMYPNKILGFGLIVLYLIFISVRVAAAAGLMRLV